MHEFLKIGESATRLYPFVVRTPIKSTRVKIVIDMKGCNYCTLCARKCPTGAITVSKEGKFWQIDGSCASCAGRAWATACATAPR